MRYRVELTDEASDELKRLAPGPRSIVRRQLRSLASDPHGAACKELTNNPGAHRAVADGYRILYRLTVAPRVAAVFRIRPRAAAYEDFEP